MRRRGLLFTNATPRTLVIKYRHLARRTLHEIQLDTGQATHILITSRREIRHFIRCMDLPHC